MTLKLHQLDYLIDSGQKQINFLAISNFLLGFLLYITNENKKMLGNP